MFSVAVGHSEDPDSIDAINEAIEKCEHKLQKNKPNAGLLFASTDYDHLAILKHINEKFPGIELVGCTSSGEISSSMGYLEGSLLLVLFSSDRIKIHADVVRNMSKGDVHNNFQTTIKRVLEKSNEPPKLCMVFPDIFTIGTLNVTEEIKDALGKDIPIVGEGASDFWDWSSNRQFYKTEVLQDCAPLLIFSGPLHYAVSVESGWEPFSTNKLVCKYENNVFQEIGEGTALDFYKHYLGGPPSLAYPLAIYETEEKDQVKKERMYLRGPLVVDEEKGSIVMTCAIPEANMTCRIARGKPDTLLKVMGDLIEKTTGEAKTYDCVFIASCSCRQQVLGTRIQEESTMVKNVFSEKTPCFGFYGYSQISPYEVGGESFTHSQTVVLLALGEERG